MVTKKHSSHFRGSTALSGGKRKFARRALGSRVAEKHLAQTRIYLPEVTPGPLAAGSLRLSKPAKPRRICLLRADPAHPTRGRFSSIAPTTNEYRPLLKAIVFAVHACEFTARLALEEPGSERLRLERLISLITECRLVFTILVVSAVRSGSPAALQHAVRMWRLL